MAPCLNSIRAGGTLSPGGCITQELLHSLPRKLTGATPDIYSKIYELLRIAVSEYTNPVSKNHSRVPRPATKNRLPNNISPAHAVRLTTFKNKKQQKAVALMNY
ncbi:hypothetical protein SB816_26070 [Achromobacter sp. SIMBA_011]|uniref:hypothetical protein n=1 Tax=Achromobacter sp. SIMBA_011 TaxID=3085759 RepID=UPI00397C5773